MCSKIHKYVVKQKTSRKHKVVSKGKALDLLSTHSQTGSTNQIWGLGGKHALDIHPSYKANSMLKSGATAALTMKRGWKKRSFQQLRLLVIRSYRPEKQSSTTQPAFWMRFLDQDYKP